MTKFVQELIRLSVFLVIFFMVGCAGSFERPRNLAGAIDGPYQVQRQSMSDAKENPLFAAASSQNLGRCQDMDLALTGPSVTTGLGAAFEEPAVLSPGDLIQLQIVRGEGFDGDFVISPIGYVRLPFIGDIPAAGTTVTQLENTIARLLVTGGYYRPNFVQVSIDVLHWAPIQIGRATRLNSSHTVISYAVFCLKKKKQKQNLNRNKKLKQPTTSSTSLAYHLS